MYPPNDYSLWKSTLQDISNTPTLPDVLLRRCKHTLECTYRLHDMDDSWIISVYRATLTVSVLTRYTAQDTWLQHTVPIMPDYWQVYKTLFARCLTKTAQRQDTIHKTTEKTHQAGDILQDTVCETRQTCTETRNQVCDAPNVTSALPNRTGVLDRQDSTCKWRHAWYSNNETFYQFLVLHSKRWKQDSTS